MLFNWEDELSSWGYFRTGKYHGIAKKETLQKAKKGRLEVVLTTYETFRIHIVCLNSVISISSLGCFLTGGFRWQSIPPILYSFEGNNNNE